MLTKAFASSHFPLSSSRSDIASSIARTPRRRSKERKNPFAVEGHNGRRPPHGVLRIRRPQRDLRDSVRQQEDPDSTSKFKNLSDEEEEGFEEDDRLYRKARKAQRHSETSENRDETPRTPSARHPRQGTNRQNRVTALESDESSHTRDPVRSFPFFGPLRPLAQQRSLRLLAGRSFNALSQTSAFRTPPPQVL